MMAAPPDFSSETSVGARAGRRYWTVFALALGALALLYFLTIPANHTEAEDAYWYAYDTRTKPVYALFHVHHLLYLPLMRLIYAAGHFPDAFSMMIGIDLLCGVAAVGLLFLWLDRGLRLGRTASIFAAGFMAFSYGYWRYALEAEVYLPAIVLMILLAWRVFRHVPAAPATETWTDQVLTALFGTAAMLMHAAWSAPLAVFVVPLYMLGKRRFQALAVYGVVATVLVTSAYYTAYRLQIASHDPLVSAAGRTFVGFLTGVEREPFQLAWSGLLKAGICLGANVVGSNFLFVIPAAHDKLSAAFATHDLLEENFMAQRYSPTLAHLALALMFVLLGMIGFAAIRRMDWSRTRLRAFFTSLENLAVLLWLGIYCTVVFIVEPDGPENWICALPPLAAVSGLLVHGLYRNLAAARLRWIFLALLLLQNLVGGFLMIHRPESDFNRDKAAWIVGHAHAGDVVFSRDNDVFTRYLRYYSPATVLNCGWDNGAATREKIQSNPAAAGGTRYLFTDVIEPPDYMRRSRPDLYDDLDGLRRELSSSLSPTGADDVKRLP